jgi:hypothetical protein
LASRERLDKLKKELAEKEEQVAEFNSQWNAEKEILNKAKALKLVEKMILFS